MLKGSKKLTNKTLTRSRSLKLKLEKIKLEII